MTQVSCFIFKALWNLLVRKMCWVFSHQFLVITIAACCTQWAWQLQNQFVPEVQCHSGLLDGCLGHPKYVVIITDCFRSPYVGNITICRYTLESDAVPFNAATTLCLPLPSSCLSRCPGKESCSNLPFNFPMALWGLTSVHWSFFPLLFTFMVFQLLPCSF